MSTIDPVSARRATRLRRAGARRFLAAATACAAAAAVCAFLLGLGIGEMANMLRHSVIDSVFDDRDPMPTFWGIGTIGYLWMLGPVGTIAGSAAAAWLLDAYRGGEPQPPVLAPIATCAVAVAVALNARTWLAPLEVGVRLDPVFHEDEGWGVFGWIAYYADLWFPALVAVVAVLVVVFAIGDRRRLRRRLADRDRLLAAGRRVKGTVTEAVVRTAANDQGQLSVVGVKVTVKFTDDQGVERWVTRLSRDRNTMSGTAEVLFDPRRPGDDDLIFVALQRDPLPADWLGTPI
jgi:hypothetical protein